MARAWTELADRVEKIGLAGTTANVTESAPQSDAPLPASPAPELPIVENGDPISPGPAAGA